MKYDSLDPAEQYWRLTARMEKYERQHFEAHANLVAAEATSDEDATASQRANVAKIDEAYKAIAAERAKLPTPDPSTRPRRAAQERPERSEAMSRSVRQRPKHTAPPKRSQARRKR